jgi:hypothetical protein
MPWYIEVLLYIIYGIGWFWGWREGFRRNWEYNKKAFEYTHQDEAGQHFIEGIAVGTILACIWPALAIICVVDLINNKNSDKDWHEIGERVAGNTSATKRKMMKSG